MPCLSDNGIRRSWGNRPEWQTGINGMSSIQAAPASKLIHGRPIDSRTAQNDKNSAITKSLLNGAQPLRSSGDASVSDETNTSEKAKKIAVESFLNLFRDPFLLGNVADEKAPSHSTRRDCTIVRRSGRVRREISDNSGEASEEFRSRCATDLNPTNGLKKEEFLHRIMLPVAGPKRGLVQHRARGD